MRTLRAPATPDRRSLTCAGAFVAATLVLAPFARAQPSARPAAEPEQATPPAATTPPPDAQPAPGDGSATGDGPAAPGQAPTPAPAPAAAPAGDPSASERAELAALQAELAAVMDDLVQARTRVAVLGKSLFKTRVRVKLDNRAAPEQQAARVELWLDGAPIFSGDGAALRDPERVLWEGFTAPGAHVLTLEVEQRAQDDDTYRYTLRDSFRVVVVRERRTDLRLVLDDDSDMAEDFPDDREGSYELQTRLEARAVEPNDE
jgi:hypothetical protein